MSKKLNTSTITDTSQMPIKKGTLQFLQDMHKEDLNAVIAGLIGEAVLPQPYVLFGCKNTGSGSTYNISGGAIFFLNEVYYVDAAAFTTSGAQVPVLTITTTQYTSDADPVTFTDATTQNVHNIRKIVIAAGASGSGTADYSTCIFDKFHVTDLVDAEKQRALAAEVTLQGEIDTINGAWTYANNTTDITASGGSGLTIAGQISYKITGKTMHVTGTITIQNTTSPTGAEVLIPGGKVSKAFVNSMANNVPCTVIDGATQTTGYGNITGGNPNKISIIFGSLTNTVTTTVYYSATFEIQ